MKLNGILLFSKRHLMKYYHSCSCSAVRTPHRYKGGAFRQVRGKEKVEYRDKDREKERHKDRDKKKAKTKLNTRTNIGGTTETKTNPKTDIQIFATKNVNHLLKISQRLSFFTRNLESTCNLEERAATSLESSKVNFWLLQSFHFYRTRVRSLAMLVTH